MKNINLLLFTLIFTLSANAQTDTIFKKDNTIIYCKITDVGTNKIFYKKKLDDDWIDKMSLSKVARYSYHKKAVAKSKDSISGALSKGPIALDTNSRYKISDLNRVLDNSKMAYGVAGVAFLASGLFTILTLNSKAPSPVGTNNPAGLTAYQGQLDAYNNQQKSYQTASAILTTLGGVIMFSTSIRLGQRKYDRHN